MTAQIKNAAWTRTIEACGPTNGYWPRLRIDAMDRMHVLFARGWASGQQSTTYLRKNAAGTRDVWNPYLASDYMSTDPLAMTLDASGEPIMFISGQLVSPNAAMTSSTKTPIFDGSASRAFVERDTTGKLHFVGMPFVPDSPTMSTARMRYASRVGTTVAVEIVRTENRAQPLGLVLDSANRPHIVSWNPGTTGQGELWHSTKTASGWVDDLVASDVPAQVALTISHDELLVVTPGKLFRRAPTATTWTASVASVLSSAKHLSAVVAADGTLHVAFQVVGATRSNRSAPAPVYHASVRL